GIRDLTVTGVQTCALPILKPAAAPPPGKAARPTDTMPDVSEAAAGGDGKTMFLGTAPARPTRKQGAQEENGATRMLSPEESQAADRKSTRLNSSHSQISYA